jgi:UDP-N-acetylmuramoylalanine--D-glutamate ligase
MHQIHDYLSQFSDKEIVILGLGREGLSTFRFLRKYLPHQNLWLIDEKGLANLDDQWQEIFNTDHNVFFSAHLEHSQLHDAPGVIVFKTPGIPPHHKLIEQSKALKSAFTSNSDLFFTIVDLINANLPSQNKKISTIGVTGTKGKSTAASIIGHVLTSAGIHSFLGGNIGIAPLSLIPKLIDVVERNLTNFPVFAVLELSCHQLNDITHSPNYAVILDITEEHLDYYKNFNEYVQAKSRICMFQSDSDFAVLDSQLYIPNKIASLSNAEKLTFNYQRNIKDNWITWNNEKVADLDTISLIGQHTINNALPAVAIAKHLGISNETISQSLISFKSLPHRLELIAQKDGVSYYNDSLSTTPVATIAALESFKNNPIVLIAGGFDRGLDYSNLAQTIINHQVKHLILLPDTGEIILDEVRKRESVNINSVDMSSGEDITSNASNTNKIKFTLVASMQQAVIVAKQSSQPGDIVLMSPASASFNLFEDYQDRGDQFRKFVNSQI